MQFLHLGIQVFLLEVAHRKMQFSNCKHWIAFSKKKVQSYSVPRGHIWSIFNAIGINMLIHSDFAPNCSSSDILRHQTLRRIYPNSSPPLPSLFYSLICILPHARAVSTHLKYLETSVPYLPAAIICVLWLYCGQKPHGRASHHDSTKTRSVHYNFVRDGLVHRAFSFANRRRSAPFRSVRAILSREHAISTAFMAPSSGYDLLIGAITGKQQRGKI